MVSAINSRNPPAALVKLKLCAVTNRDQIPSKRRDRGEQIKGK
jgi:hypothetical protein